MHDRGLDTLGSDAVLGRRCIRSYRLGRSGGRSRSAVAPRTGVLAASGLSAAAGPLAWDLILRHAGGDFFVDAPGLVFPISLEDTGSGVFATALAALVLGFGPLRAATAQRLALTATICGAAALLVDIYLY
jgi:hypothetical protein